MATAAATATGGTRREPTARAASQAPAAPPAIRPSSATAATAPVRYWRMLPANIPTTIGRGTRRITRSPTPSSASARIATPATRFAPTSSAKVCSSATDPR